MKVRKKNGLELTKFLHQRGMSRKLTYNVREGAATIYRKTELSAICDDRFIRHCNINLQSIALMWGLTTWPDECGIEILLK